MKHYLFWFLFSLALLLPFEVHSNKQALAQSKEGNATVEDIIDNTDNWLGKTVTLTGKIDEMQGDSSFTLESDNYFDSDRVLIINKSGAPLPELPEENTTIRITGEVNLVDGMEYFGDTSEDVSDEYEQKPAIVADYIILAPDPVEIVETPANYYDREVAVSGKVADILDENAFTLEEFSLKSDRNLLVLNTTGEPMPESAADVLVMGTVRPYNKAELEREYGYGEDLSVYIADSSEDDDDIAVLIVEQIAPADVDLSEVEIDVTQ